VEAQERVAIEVAEHAVMYLKDGIVSNAINAPRGSLDSETEPYMPLVKNMGSIIQQIVGNHPLNKLEISYCGNLASKQTKLLTVTTVIGYLEGVIGSANMINALPVAKSKGIEIFESTKENSNDYASMVEMKFTYDGITRELKGTVIGGQPKILALDEYATEITLADKMIILRYNDTPGVIGSVGIAIGEAGINIAHMAVGRAHGKATMFLTIDQDVPEDVLKAVGAKVNVEEIKYVKLGQ
jgi:D-3-phosphoglycerate dehydrogenase